MTDLHKEKIAQPHNSEAIHSYGSREQTTTHVDVGLANKAAELIGKDASLEGQEGSGNVDGNISEDVGEDKNTGSQGGVHGGALTDEEKEELRAKLLASVPTQEVMIKEIRKKLISQERHLIKKITKLESKAHKNAFQLTIMVQQLRMVREYFRQIARATYELVKHLWLKIVHGV